MGYPSVISNPIAEFRELISATYICLYFIFKKSLIKSIMKSIGLKKHKNLERVFWKNRKQFRILYAQSVEHFREKKNLQEKLEPDQKLCLIKVVI